MWRLGRGADMARTHVRRVNDTYRPPKGYIIRTPLRLFHAPHSLAEMVRQSVPVDEHIEMVLDVPEHDPDQ